MIECIIIANESGLPLYSKIYQKNIDESLLMAFFSALKSFARSFMRENSELKWIHMGNALLDFESAEFETLGRLDVLMVSREINPTTSHAIISQITEEFVIFLDEICNEDPQIKICIDRGMSLKLPSFDGILQKIIANNQQGDATEINLNVTIPNWALSIIRNMFKINPTLKEMYEDNERLLLEQIFSDYSKAELENQMRKMFKNAIKKE